MFNNDFMRALIIAIKAKLQMVLICPRLPANQKNKILCVLCASVVNIS